MTGVIVSDKQVTAATNQPLSILRPYNKVRPKGSGVGISLSRVWVPGYSVGRGRTECSRD